VQVGKLGVDLSVQTNTLRNQSRLEYAAQRNVGGRTCTEIGGVWIDEGFTDKTPVVAVKAQSDAYFRILERHAQVKDVFQLGPRRTGPARTLYGPEGKARAEVRVGAAGPCPRPREEQGWPLSRA
jgi:hypothetical protein